MQSESCFLCDPDSDLLIAQRGSIFAMVGLGPITKTYAMIAASDHLRSFADLAEANPAAVQDICDTRARLERWAGPLMLTEHGRVPVCRENGNDHDVHCFHAHALLFSSRHSILADARSYYAACRDFTDLLTSLRFASGTNAYLLVSDSPAQYSVLHEPLNVPRQLARSLVAIRSGEGGFADWQNAPRREEAIEMARRLRLGVRESL